MAQFLLLIRSEPEAFPSLTPEEIQQVIQKYNDWGAGLRSNGTYVDANQLLDTGSTVTTSGVIDGPYAETKEEVGGYYIIEAADLAEATEIAKGCPALTYGGTVEVRGFVDYSS